MRSYYPNNTLRTAIVVHITKNHEWSEVHTAMMSDSAWNKWMFEMDVAGKEYRRVDDSTVLIIRKEKGES